jgi:predicted RNA-binding Zn ribbon-like protein
METSDRIRQQRVVGGNPALDLLNTQNGPADGAPEDDVLHDYADLLAWSAVIGALSEAEADRLHQEGLRHPDAAGAAFQRAISTRAYLYELFHDIARGAPENRALVNRLAGDEAEALGHGRLVADEGGYRWTWEPGGRALDLGRPVWEAIHAAAALLVSGRLDRVKGCSSCRFHFLDESKNRSRRWCSMDDCGTRTKSRRYVARRAAARSSARRRSGTA